MSRKKLISVLLVGVISCFSIQGCVRPYNKPEFTEITPSQTAFLIPMIGDTKDQTQLASEEMLKNNMISAKRIQIPKKWIQMGRFWFTGKYMPTATVIIVERKPVTREWTETQGDGTSSKNEGITAETKESIGFLARMNCTAQIDEEDAPKFLYHYNGKSLEDIMDTEIRARVESKFNEEVAKYSLDEVLINKECIMDVVRKDVVTYFEERGITITTLGLKGELTYLDDSIQKSINAKFKAQKDLEAQALENKKNTEKAEAEAQAIRSQASTINSTIELKKAEAEVKKAEAEIKKAEAMKEWKNVQVIGDNPIITNGLGK